MQKLSLETIARDQLAAAARGSAGRASSTVFGGHEHALRQAVIALQAGAVISDHENPGEATLYVLSGRVELTSAADSWQGRQGDLIIIPDATHGLRALEDSAILYTAVPRGHVR